MPLHPIENLVREMEESRFSEVERLRMENTAMRAAIKMIEWQDHQCPVCRCFKCDGHSTKCPIWQAYS